MEKEKLLEKIQEDHVLIDEDCSGKDYTDISCSDISFEGINFSSERMGKICIIDRNQSISKDGPIRF